MIEQIARLTREIDYNNAEDIKCAETVLTVLRGAVITGTCDELIRGIAGYAEKITPKLAEMESKKNGDTD